MSWTGCQNNPIYLNFYLQKSLESFEKNSADKMSFDKNSRWKVPCPVLDRVNILFSRRVYYTLCMFCVLNPLNVSHFSVVNRSVIRHKQIAICFNLLNDMQLTQHSLTHLKWHYIFYPFGSRTDFKKQKENF